MIDYFLFFGVPAQFAIEQEVLAAKKRALLATYHPDQASTPLPGDSSIQDNATQSISADTSANSATNGPAKVTAPSAELINQAYATLAAPDTRAAHLLALQGTDANLDVSIGDLAFLQEALELRENLEDAASDTQLTSLKQKTLSWLAKLEVQFAKHFTAKEPVQALDIARKMAFLVKVARDIDDAFDDLAEDDLTLSADLF